jgi:hypothetical protein
MRLISNSFKNNEVIPGEFAFCIPNDRGHVCLGSNRIYIGTMFRQVPNPLPLFVMIPMFPPNPMM